jgi:hypothetical protein
VFGQAAGKGSGVAGVSEVGPGVTGTARSDVPAIGNNLRTAPGVMAYNKTKLAAALVAVNEGGGNGVVGSSAGAGSTAVFSGSDPDGVVGFTAIAATAAVRGTNGPGMRW